MSLLTARNTAADLLDRHVSRAAGDAVRNEGNLHSLLSDLRAFDDADLPGDLADALGALAVEAIRAADWRVRRPVAVAA